MFVIYLYTMLKHKVRNYFSEQISIYLNINGIRLKHKVYIIIKRKDIQNNE